MNGQFRVGDLVCLRPYPGGSMHYGICATSWNAAFARCPLQITHIEGPGARLENEIFWWPLSQLIPWDADLPAVDDLI